MESQYFGHEHPLAFSEDQSNQSEADQCSRCGEVMAGPSFSCAECEFYLHKKCAEAPAQIDHPFHRDHPLHLLPNQAPGFLINEEKGEMESQYFGHEHPLAFNEAQSNQSEAAHCSRCGELMSGPSFSCAECEFYLHKKCAEAPSQINHPFHRDHPLCLLPNPPEKYKGGFFCHFCGENGKMFVYHCSCDIDLHVKCALFTYDIAEKNLGELKVIDYKDPLISDENDNKELESAKCFGCREPLLDSVYYSLDCGFNLHKKCAELPFEINYPCHYRHPLILQFSVPNLSCIICHDTINSVGFFYCCSPCNLVMHIACMSPPPTIEDKGHQHPFTLLFRQIPFTCDACGVEGNHVPYICLNCNLLVHKKCISLPRIIKFVRHEHPIFHTYFLLKYDQSKNWDCVLCRDEVNTEHGGYYCSDCHFIVHVNCVIKMTKAYYIVEPDEILHGNSALLSDISIESFTAIERNKDGEATKIKHFSHVHDLILSDKIIEDDKYCDGCTLSISSPFYYCSDCDFFLHKECAELPKKKHFWSHECQQLLILVSDYIFRCFYCGYVCNGFAYKCDKCARWICLRCIAPDTLTCEGHEHPLPFYWKYEGQCNGCGDKITQAYRCKECNFSLCVNCVKLPVRVGHKCDKHLLALTYHDDNTYSETHFCDICEEDRNPSHWFYSCAICDTSVHLKCALGRYPFMKAGRIIGIEDQPHSVALVKKMYYYPKCFVCGNPCRDLAVECIESGCEYIAHWQCIQPSLPYGVTAAFPEKDNTRKLLKTDAEHS